MSLSSIRAFALACRVASPSFRRSAADVSGHPRRGRAAPLTRALAAALAVTALLAFASSTSHAVLIDWIGVGDEGNLADTTGFGAVEYRYRISATEVTNDQYAEFLNAIAASDSNGVWNDGMDITRTGGDGSYAYTANPTFGEKPVNNVSFLNSMRFVNWLENGQPTGAQGVSTTEDGTYLIIDGMVETRDGEAFYSLPSEDEWYKAAYYEPGGDVDNYWLYPTATNDNPFAEAPADEENSANFMNAVASMGMTTTDVGAYTEATSYYGGFDFGGNVWEWTEGVDGSDRVIRGGAWNGFGDFLAATARSSLLPDGESSIQGVGFRIVSAPEPGTALLGVIGGLLLMLLSGRRSRSRSPA